MFKFIFPAPHRQFARLGWSKRNFLQHPPGAKHFQPLIEKDYLPGRVSYQNQHLYRVYTEQGELLA